MFSPEVSSAKTSPPKTLAHWQAPPDACQRRQRQTWRNRAQRHCDDNGTSLHGCYYRPSVA